MGPFVSQKHMFLTVFKKSNLFTTINTRSSMKVFCFSFDFLYVVILLKNAKMDSKVITFRTLELCFLKAFVSAKCCHHTISLTYILKY
jgi:hypothetical protein